MAFSKDFLDKIKAVLDAEREKLEKELGKFATKNPHAANDGSDDYDATYEDMGTSQDDNVHEVEKFAVDKSLEETLEKALRDVNKSVARLKEGTYGICKYCDKPIDEKRLLARPTSGSCVSCKKAITDEA